jgi:hypothetical protein
VSSLEQALLRLRLGQLRGPLETVAHRQAHGENNGTHTDYRMHIQRRVRCSDQEQRSPSPEGPGPKVFGSNLCDACFPKRFRVPNNIVKCVRLEDYHLTCKAGKVDSDMFIIQFLPIYLANTSKAYLDHLPRNLIDCWEDIKEIFTGNFQGTYIRPGNPCNLKGCRQK